MAKKSVVLLNDVPNVGKHGHVVELESDEAKSLVNSGAADDNAKAVAYALKTHPQPEAEGASASTEGEGDIVK